MIKTFTAHTDEVDDAEAAVEQVLGQLDFSKLLKNSVAIISCYADFVDSGAYAAVCEILPCDVVGTTTITNTVEGAEDDIVLTLMILSSDDVSFETGISGSILSEDEALLQSAYQKAADRLPGTPSLIFSFAPLLSNVGGDFFARAFDGISNGTPNFGTVAVDHNADYSEAVVLYNGASHHDCCAFILFHGEIHPKYYVAGISNEKAFREKGVITASQGNQLQTVNDKPIGDYLEGLGLQKNADGSIAGINSFPFIMDMNDGMMPVIRIMFALTPEGYAVCGGDVPVGATLSVGAIDAEEVLTTTEAKLLEIIKHSAPSFLILYSCVGRYFSMGYNPAGELEKIKALLDEAGIPYHFAYSGCEICPVYPQDGFEKTVNRSHNDTLVICAF